MVSAFVLFSENCFFATPLHLQMYYPAQHLTHKNKSSTTAELSANKSKNLKGSTAQAELLYCSKDFHSFRKNAS